MRCSKKETKSKYRHFSISQQDFVHIVNSNNKSSPDSNLSKQISSSPLTKNQMKAPLILRLPRSGVDNSPKLSNIEFEHFCKRKIKFINYYVFSNESLEELNDPNEYYDAQKMKSRLLSSLKNLKHCQSFYFGDGSKFLRRKSVLKLKNSSFACIKSIKEVECEGKFVKLLRNTRISSGNTNLENLTCLGSLLKSVKLRQVFQSNEKIIKALKILNRLSKLQKALIEMEDSRKVLNNQHSLSKTFLSLKQLKEVDLGLTFMIEREDIFDKNEDENDQINAFLPLWRRVTGLHLSDDDIQLDKFMEKISCFQVLREFSFYGEPKFREDFDSFHHLNKLQYLRKMTISISLLNVYGHTVTNFLEGEFLPKSLEELTLRIEIQRLGNVIEKAVSSGKFVQRIKEMTSLKYFLFSIGIERERFEQKDHKALSTFFTNIIENISKDLEDLILVVFGFQSILVNEDKFALEEEHLIHLISYNLPKLKNLFIKFTSLNTNLAVSSNFQVLPSLQYLNIEGSLPLSLIKLLNHNCLQEFYFQTQKTIDLQEFIQFLSDLSKFQKLRTLSLGVKSLQTTVNDHQVSQLNQNLFLAILSIFQNIQSLYELSLRLSSVWIEKKLAVFLFKQSNYKNNLKFCSLEFDNCEILKEYFSTFITEGFLSTEDHDSNFEFN